MTESGGSATQAGIFYQNTIAALALADLLDLGQLSARERLLEVRVEATEHVDDIVLRFADGHQDFQSVKLSLRLRNGAWTALWQSLHAQLQSGFGPVDQLTIVVAERNAASDAVAQLCERAATAVDHAAFVGRLADAQSRVLTSIEKITGGAQRAFELLRRTRLLHLAEDAIESELGRRRLTGASPLLPSLLPILRDIVGGAARRRGLFRPASLRRHLKLEHNLLLGEPPEWGLPAFREAIKQMARLTIPGTSVSGAAEDMFVWPRARTFDTSKRTDFENENLDLSGTSEEGGIDLRTFPTDQFDRVVVVAGPGHGKSALLTAIAGRLAGGPLVPIAIPLASLAAADTGVIQFLRTAMSTELEISADWERLAEQGLLVLLLDGLDEVPATSRPQLMRRITNFSARFSQSPWILTVRDAAVLGGLPQSAIVELLPLSDDDIERFAATMRDRLGRLQPWEVVRRLKLYPDLDRLARIPLFLMMLLVTADLNDPRPLTRSDLIESYLATLFSPERSKATGASDDRGVVLRAIAETLAFERLEKQEIGATEREVRAVINRLVSDVAEADALYERLRTNGILRPQSAIRLQFPYPIVQEYLAARHLIDKYLDSLHQRIEDAVQRPWAQVIQFALELAPDAGPVIEAMLLREDDAFATGLRLVGRCIANGAIVSDTLRFDVAERLAEFWVQAPSDARERVGRVLADGFWHVASPKLEAALHRHRLLDQGAGDILSKRIDRKLTLSVLQMLIANASKSMGIQHRFKYALRASGDDALQLIINAMNPVTANADVIRDISGLLWNFDTASISPALALKVARDERLPWQARFRAYLLAGAPLEDAGVELAIKGLEQADWDRNYAAADLIGVHANPPAFFEWLLRSSTIPLDRRVDLAACIGRHIEDDSERRTLARTLVKDSSIDNEVCIALRLMEARYGDAEQFRSLVESIPTLPVRHAATTIALFGHHPDRALAEHAAALTRVRAQSAADIVLLANSVRTGMRNVFEMDWGFGGVVRAAPPHAGIAPWIELLEDWSDRVDLAAKDRMRVRTAAAGLGSEPIAAALERDVLAIDDFDAEVWTTDDEYGHVISSALHQLERRLPALPDELIERLLRSKRYNIAMYAVRVLGDRGDELALRQLIKLHRLKPKWSLGDQAANKIEQLGARLQIVVRKDGLSYRIG
ncbi:NACHT domain-containing protein [Azorhizobium sp. AG788]|uniref:NACHT domain-containing protein n=1 Tax=Azorhizobium sp. AG788 TaxID=2183897 RepID=UPI003139E7FE